MARCILQQMEGMEPYEDKMKFKDSKSNAKATVELSKPKSEGTFARLKRKFKKGKANAQMQDDFLGGEPVYSAGTYRNIPTLRASYMQATGCALDHSGTQLPTQPPVPDRGIRVPGPALPAPTLPHGRSRPHRRADPGYGEDIYEYPDTHRSRVQQQLNLKQQDKLAGPPPIPPRWTKPAPHQVYFESKEDFYDTNPEQSLSDHQVCSDDKKVIQARDEESSDEDINDEKLMEPYVRILQAKRASGDSTTDADGYTSVIPRETETYINGDFAPTSTNQSFPEHGRVWLTWTVDGKEVRLPVSIAERGQAAES